jgi:hypothetical protein
MVNIQISGNCCSILQIKILSIREKSKNNRGKSAIFSKKKLIFAPLPSGVNGDELSQQWQMSNISIPAIVLITHPYHIRG